MNPPSTARRSPYKGLIPYAEDDAPFFFGREKETRLIIANMFASPLTLLYGASGVGKSSVLRAGVVHELRRRNDLAVVPFSTWQTNPVGDLVQTIAEYVRRADPDAWDNVPNHLKPGSPTFDQLTLSEFLQACYKQTGRRLMIILDQFEEYFLYHPQEDNFADEFPQAVLQTGAAVSFLISIREDSLAKLDRFEGRIPTLFDNYLRVEHLNYEAARAAIEKPLEQYNKRLPAGEQLVTIEPALVATVLEQVQTGQVILGEAGHGVLKTEAASAQVETPFLQMVMTRLWDEEMRAAGSHKLRFATLSGLGGAERIVRTHLDETMSTLSPERQGIAAEVFHYLVTPSGTKIAHTIPDLAEYAGLSRRQLAPALEDLASGDTRILRGVEPPPDQPGETRYEIFHDVLAAAILDWRGRYMQAREVAAQQLKLAAERQRTKRLRVALLGLAALLLLMTGLTVYAYRQRRNALAAQGQAATARGDALQKAQLAETRAQEAEAERIKTANALITADKEKNRANEQANLASQREAEANAQKARAEKQTKFAEEQRAMVEGARDTLQRALDEQDPVKRTAILEEAIGVKRLTAEEERRKQEAVINASRAGRLLVRTPPQYGLKLWANGATLRVKFLGGRPDAQQLVKQIIGEWAQHANLHFDYVTSGDAEIRVSFKEPYTSYAYVGTDALGVNPQEPTLELGIIGTVSGELKKMYVRHEFGHTLGLIHEINSPNANIPWDRPKVYEYYMRPPNNWTKDQVDSFIFKRYTNIEYRPFDPQSIMMYSVPKSLTGGRFEAQMPTQLSEGDKAFIRKLYPPTN